MKTPKAAALSAAVMVATVISANAHTIEFSTWIPEGKVTYDYPFTLQGFNTSWGTLTGITITLDTNVRVDIGVLNLNPQDSVFTDAFAAIPLKINGPGGTTVSASATANLATGTALAAPPAGGVTTTWFRGLTANGSDTVAIADPSLFHFYETASTVSFDAFGKNGHFGGTAESGVYFGGNAWASGLVTVSYTFSGVPELSTWAMMGLGFAGLGFAGFRARKTAVPVE